MHELPRRALGGHEIKPSPRAHARGQLQNALCDGTAAAKIIKQPAVQPRGLQVFLYRLHVKTHGAAHSLRHSTAKKLFFAAYASRLTSARTCSSVTPRTSTRLLRL